ncbi:MAG: EamA family transporter [Bacillota bacterium]
MREIIFAIMAMLSWGIAPILGKIGLGKLEPFTALLIRSLTIAAVVVIAGLVTGKFTGIMGIAAKPALFIAGEGLLAALLGQLAYYYAIKNGEVSVVSPLVAAFPVVTVLLACLFLGEKFTVQKILGTGIIVLGVIVLRL